MYRPRHSLLWLFLENLIQSPDLFLGKPGDLHNLIDAATLGSRLLKMLLKIYGYYENQKNNSKRSMHFCSVSRGRCESWPSFLQFSRLPIFLAPKTTRARLGIVQMLHQSLRPRCQCRSVTGRLGKKRRNFESLKSRCNLQNLRMFFLLPKLGLGSGIFHRATWCPTCSLVLGVPPPCRLQHDFCSSVLPIEKWWSLHLPGEQPTQMLVWWVVSREITSRKTHFAALNFRLTSVFHKSFCWEKWMFIY